MTPELRAAIREAISAWDDALIAEPCDSCLKSGVGLIDFDSEERLDNAIEALVRLLPANPTPEPQEKP